ncbi:putative circularly permuted ATP-grasp superfamily protein [Bradyrhizobium huanghuaihaiense]
MGWLSMATRKELTAAAGVRYRRSDRAKKARILDEFVSRLQVEYPGDYPNKLLRTLQRRLKSWRSEQANALLFASEKMPPGHEVTTPQ